MRSTTAPRDAAPAARTLHRPGRRGGFTVIELLVVMGIVGILATLAIPILLGSREKARHSTCESVYTALAGELENEGDTLLAEDDPRAAEKAIAIVVPRHFPSPEQAIGKNPRDLTEPAYVDLGPCGLAVPSVSSSCQAFLCYENPDRIVVSQYEKGLRSYGIKID